MNKPETMPKLGNRVVTTSLPLPLAEKIDEMAVRYDRPRGWIVKQALAAWIEIEEYRHQRTLQALESVDAGLGVTQEAVDEWVESWGTDKPLPMPKSE